MTPSRQQAPPDTAASRSPEELLDDMLLTLERHRLSPTELRILLRLSEGAATSRQLAEAITAPARTIAHARRSLSMRGLVQRRFAYDGVTPHFAFDISQSGLQLLGSLNIRRL